jgi:hypothetical protein
MDKNTKILLLLGAAGVAAYLLLKPKKATTPQTMGTPSNTTPKVIVPSVVPSPVPSPVPSIPKPTAPLTDRQTNVNNMFSTTDSGGVIRNPYSGSNGTRFDDYVSRYSITQSEIDVAKSYHPNAPLTKSNYKVSNVRSFASSNFIF